MRKLTQDKKQLTILAVAAAIIVAFLLLCYLPVRRRQNNIQKAEEKYKKEIKLAQKQVKQIPELTKKLKLLQKNVAQFDKNVPKQRRLGPFLHKIADLMNQHELTDQFVEPDQQIEAQPLNCIPIRMQCRGKLENIFNFFKDLEALDRLVRIEEARFLSKNQFDGIVRIETKAVVYYRTGDRTG